MTTGADEARRMRSSDYPSWSAYYREYQRRLAELFLVPFLLECGVEIEGAAILDVGCGNGGATEVLARRATRCVGIDVGEFPWRNSANLEFTRGDILDPSVAETFAGAFDLVVMRDVVEHIGDRPRLFRHVRSALRPGGRVFATFPPYHSAFGAHQQSELKGSVFRFVPYAHWHPGLRGIAATRATLVGFEREARDAGLAIRSRRLYLLRPSFRLRYGLPVVRFRLPRVPVLSELLVTGAYYLLDVEAE